MTRLDAFLNRTIHDISARDLMTPEVLTVYEGWSVKRLAEFFIRHVISGAPVIASDHSLVGVVSVSDIVRFESMDSDKKAELMVDHVYTESLGQAVSAEVLEKLVLHADANCTVNQIMTRTVLSVDGAASMAEVAKCMSQAKIHRVFVTDAGVVTGVISSGDILGVLAQSLA